MPRKPPSLLRHLLGLVFKNSSKQPAVASSPLGAFPQRHLPTDRRGWRAYWRDQNQHWRTEPEIPQERQKELTRLRAITAVIGKGIYPFKGVKLSRADMEWLLATHENGRGPVIWSDEYQQKRMGIDVRGADLRNLPLARLRGGISWSLRPYANEELFSAAVVLLQGANLFQAHLEGANLDGAHLEDADLGDSYLEGAELRGAHLARASLTFARLKGAHLRGAYLNDADLCDTHLENARLQNIILANDKLVGPRFADVQWSTANLAVVEWSQIKMLGDEFVALQKMFNGKVKDKATRLEEYEKATRANRQLALALQAQGLTEEAAQFAYRAQVLQKNVFWFLMLQHGVRFRRRMQALGAWLFSWFLFLLAGYGYRLWRSFLTYLLIIGLFMTMYHIIDPHLAWSEAFVVSMTAFHGRGFSPSSFTPGDPLSFVSAAEAFVGLIIEVVFIATLTRQFFSQ